MPGEHLVARHVDHAGIQDPHVFTLPANAGACREPFRHRQPAPLAGPTPPPGALSAVEPVRRPRPRACVAVLRKGDRYRKSLRANGPAVRARRWAAGPAVAVRGAWPPGTPV